MIPIPETDIDIAKSLRTKRLQIKPKWLEITDTVVFLLLATAFIVCPILMYGQFDKDNPNDRFIGYYVLPFVILLGVVLFYKKITEKRLVSIKTGFDSKNNRELIVAFMKEQGFNIIKNNKNIIIAIREHDFLYWSRQINVIFDTDAVYVCTLTLSAKVRVPSVFTAKGIVKKLDNFFRQKIAAKQGIDKTELPTLEQL